jgi:hypothetical protein
VKYPAAAFALVLSGCGTMPPWMQGPEVSEASCTASCNTHFDQCPQLFAGFPERGAVECPAEHDNCLRACKTHHAAARPPVTPVTAPSEVPPPAQAAAGSAPQAVPSTVHAVASKEARLRELKHLYEQGLVTDDVYKDRQKTILSEP